MRSTAILSQDQDLEDVLPLLVALYTKLLRLRLAGIKDAGLEIENSADDSFRESLSMRRDASCAAIWTSVLEDWLQARVVREIIFRIKVNAQERETYNTFGTVENFEEN